MNDLEGKKINYGRKNGIAFILFSLGFLIFWFMFLIYGLINDSSNAINYIVWAAIEILVNTVMLGFAIKSMNKRQKYMHRNNFTFISMLLCAATFPLPFAFVFGVGAISNQNIMNNVIAATATPTTILSFLAFAFYCSAYGKLSEPKIHNSFLYLACATLMTASVYWLVCLLGELSISGIPQLQFGNIILYILLDILYFCYTVYSIIYINKSSGTFGDKIKVVSSKKTKESLFHPLLIVFLVYSILSMSIGCYSLAESYVRPNDFIDLRYGNATGGILIGDQLFSLIVSIVMISYSFVALKEDNKKNHLLNIEVLMTCLLLKTLIPGLLGGYSYVKSFYDLATPMVPEIIIHFSFVTLAFVGLGTIIAALSLERNQKTLSALFIVITAFMLLGTSIFNITGVAYAWIVESIDWFVALLKVVFALIGFALSIFITIATMKEYPLITTAEKLIETVED